MRLDFNILWVDDQSQAVKAQMNRINLLIRKEGFRLQVKFVKSVEEAVQCLSQDIYGDHIDIVLMDYDLGVGAKGDEGLTEVRDIFPYKDIVFYSSQGNNLLKLVADKRIQGIFCSTRDELPDVVVGAFNALVKKVLDIDHSRGIVMGATSDIDQLVNDSLRSLFLEENPALSKQALRLVSKRMDDKEKDFSKSIAKVNQLTKISEIMDQHHIYTSADRIDLLIKMLGKDKSYAETCVSMAKYSKETMPRRNDLAHLSVRREGFSRKLFDKQGKEFTSEEMKTLRSALLAHQETFEVLAEELKPAKP